MVIRRTTALLLAMMLTLLTSPVSAASTNPTPGETDDAFRLAAAGDGIVLERRAEGADDWAPALRVTLDRGATRYEQRMISATDTIVAHVPRWLLDGADDGRERPTLTVNGERFEAEWLVELARPTGVSPEAFLERHGEALRDVAVALHDPDAFSEMAETLAALSAHEYGEPVESHDAPRCFGPCTRCAVGIVTYIGSSIGLIAVCGSALVTGGATAIGCLVTFLGHETAAALMISGCAMCGACLDEDEEKECPCTGQPACECG